VLLSALEQHRLALIRQSASGLQHKTPANEALGQLLQMMLALSAVLDWCELSGRLELALQHLATGESELAQCCADVLLLLDLQFARRQALAQAEQQLAWLLGVCRGVPAAATENGSAPSLIHWRQRSIWWQLAKMGFDKGMVGADPGSDCSELLRLQYRLQQSAAVTVSSQALVKEDARRRLLAHWQQVLEQSLMDFNNCSDWRSGVALLPPALQVSAQVLTLSASEIVGKLHGAADLAAELLLVGQLLLRARGDDQAPLLPLLLQLLLLVQRQLQLDLLSTQPCTARSVARMKRIRQAVRDMMRRQQRPCLAASQDQAIQRLLLHERRLIRQQLGQQWSQLQARSPCHLSSQLVTALSKLTLNAYAAGDWQLFAVLDSLRSGCSLALLLQRELPAALADCLQRLAEPGQALRSDCLPRADILCWELDLAVAQLRRSGGDLASLAVTLAGSLRLLPVAAARWQTVAGGAALDGTWLGQLGEELALLQQGARRLGVLRIAALASVLVQLYLRLSDLPRPWPSTLPLLLARAHHRLQRMLDQAAAWQEVTSAATLIEQLHGWIEPRQGRAADHRADPVGDSRQLNLRMRRRIRQALRDEVGDHDLLTLLGLLQSQDQALARLCQSSGEQCD